MLLGGHNESGEPGHPGQDSPSPYGNGNTPYPLGDGSDNQYSDEVVYHYDEPWNDNQEAEEQADGFDYHP